MAGGTTATGAADTLSAVLAPLVEPPDSVGMTTVYSYGTAHAVVMVGSYGAEGLKPRQIGPAHATIGRVNGQSRKALCGAYVTIDEQLPWPPEGYEEQQLCENCAALAAL